MQSTSPLFSYLCFYEDATIKVLFHGQYKKSNTASCFLSNVNFNVIQPHPVNASFSNKKKKSNVIFLKVFSIFSSFIRSKKDTGIHSRTPSRILSFHFISATMTVSFNVVVEEEHFSIQ